MSRVVKLEIDAKVTGLINGLKTASQATKDSAREFDSWAKSHQDSLDTVGKGMTTFGVLAAGGATLAVTKFASFDKAMSGVQAATHETTENMGLLRQAAMDAGADTAFSAEEAANGIEELAKAGVSTADVMGGGLTGALDLAAAGELGVGEAAEIAASAMTQFKLSGDQIPHLADLLAAGAGKAQGSVQDLGNALNQAGLVASSTGLTIEETTGGLAAFASAGLVGSDAGTSFKSMLQRLTPQSKAAQGQFDELGISAYDAQGEFVGLSEFAGQLQTKMAHLTPEARNAAMSIMFGSDAVRASNVLYEQGAEGIQAWINNVNDAGYAADTAALLTNNLTGDLERLGGSFDTVFIKSGGAANDVLRGLVQGAESLVDAIGSIPAPVLGVGTMLAGVAGGAALLGAAAINVIPKIRDTKDALKDLGVIGGNSGKKLGSGAKDMVVIDAAMTRGERSARKFGTALKTAGTGAVLLAGVGPAIASIVSSGNTAEIDRITASLMDLGDLPGVLDTAFKGKGNWFDGLDVKGFEDAVDIIIDPSWSEKADQNISKFLTFGGRSSSNWEFAKKNVDQLDGALASMAKSGNIDDATAAYELLAQKASDAGIPTEKLAELFPQYSAALQLVDAESKKAAEGTGELESALAGMGEEAEAVVASLDDILASIFELGRDSRSVSEAQDALTGSMTTLNESIAENGKKFTGNSEAALKNREALRGVANDMEGVVEAQARAGASSGEIQSTMQSTYDSLMKATGGSEELVRTLMSIPEGVSVKTWMETTAKEIAEGTANAIEEIPGYKKVEVVVSEDGTVGQVQSRIDEVSGKTEYVLVSENGTTARVQAGIAEIKGKDVPVWVDDNGTVYTVDGKIQGIKGKNVTIVADASTASAEAQLNNAARTRIALIQQRVVGGGAQTSTGRGGRGGQTFSSGGYTGAGAKFEEAGIVHRDEHVIRKESRNKLEMSHPGLLDHMNRFGVVPGLGGFANGGAVGRAESKVKSTKRTYDRIDGKKANRLRKLAAKDQWEAAKDELKAAKASSKAADKRSKDAKKRAADAAKEARERQGRLSETRRDVGTSLRRGEIRDAFTSGSGLGQVDKLMELSRNKDYGLSTRRRAAKDAAGLEKALASLTKRSEGLEKALDAAKSKADELRAVRDAVAGDLRGEFSLSGMLSETRQDLGSNPFTAKSISSKANKTARRIEIFAGRLNRLRKLGYGETIIQEIAALGTEDGILAAGALMDASKSERSNIIKAYDRLDSASGKAGQYVTESMYKGGLDAADGLVRGLEAKTKSVEDAFYKLGKNGEKAFRRALDMHSPSRVMMAAGVDAGDGVEIGLLSKVGAVESAAEKLMTPQAFTIPPSPEVSRYQVAQNTMLRVDSDQIASAVAGALGGMSFEMHGNTGKLIAKMVDSEVQSASRGKKSLYR